MRRLSLYITILFSIMLTRHASAISTKEKSQYTITSSISRQAIIAALIANQKAASDPAQNTERSMYTSGCENPLQKNWINIEREAVII